MSAQHQEELESLRAEWHTSEGLLAESQKDNEEKHRTIERYKQYVKELEKLAETACGSNWREDHGIPPLNTSAPLNTASTPLPKPTPASLRYSTSVSLSNKRSSRLQPRQISHQLENRHLDSLREVSENVADNTPTGALRRLQGKKAVSEALSREVSKEERQTALTVLLNEMEQSLARRENAVKELLKEARAEKENFS